jgi:uncharacterized sulfatase
MQRPDIIFIVLDTQRADRLGCYGHQARETGSTITPNLDRFASEAALFERAISPAQWTIPSHASMFTGLYPTAHQVTQSEHGLGPDRPLMAEVLQASGYETIGFCNNPLVGILNNGMKRGFDTFYNYGGAFPSMPRRSTRLPWPLNSLLERYTQFLRRISYPIQNFFGRSDLAFRISLSAKLTPLWSKFTNFKGQNSRSVHDVSSFLHRREEERGDKPLFLFLNLMETHLPFWPPGEYVDQVAPYMQRDQEARDIMARWNREAYLWQAPLAEPLDDLQSRVLNDMYDAEVAYQDDYLEEFFNALESRRNSENTLTIIVSDHGDGLGEHDYFGHAFVVFQELVHVPLIVHWPKRILEGTRIYDPVSTRRIYHTILDAAGPLPDEVANVEAAEVHDLTFLETIFGRDPEQGTAFAEAYPPLNFAKAVQQRQPELLERFRCMELRRTVVKDNLKLINVSDLPDELFNLEIDPLELDDLMPERPIEVTELNREIDEWIRLMEAQRENLAAGIGPDLEGDESLLQRLRGLGYIE